VTVAAARAELVTKLKTLQPLTGRTYRYLPDSITPPCAFVGTLTHDPRAAFDAANLTAQVWVAVSRAASTDRAVDLLDEYADGGDFDVAEALHSESEVWDSLAVVGSEWPISIEVGQGTYAAIRFDCELFL
jgi:hypothetical protein